MSTLTIDEYRALHAKKIRKPQGNEEHCIQCECVRWFSEHHPELKGRLFAVPNGGRRDAVTASRLKDEGVVAGVADLMLMVTNHYYCALLVEMKTEKGRQSESQKEWERIITSGNEYKYVVCRSLDDFMKEINEYLNNQ